MLTLCRAGFLLLNIEIISDGSCCKIGSTYVLYNKYNEYELKGVPLRIAVGPKDMANGTVELYKRESGEKTAVKIEDIDLNIDKYLYKEQNNLLKKNQTFREEHTFTVESYEEFKEKITQ